MRKSYRSTADKICFEVVIRNSGLPLSLKKTERERCSHLFLARIPQRRFIRDSTLTDDDKTAGYDALRHELSEVLKEQRTQDRLTKALLAPDAARLLEVEELTRSVADILVTACPQHDANTYAAALADATVLVGGALSSATQSADTPSSSGAPARVKEP